jgi:hypothetical protein
LGGGRGRRGIGGGDHGVRDGVAAAAGGYDDAGDERDGQSEGGAGKDETATEKVARVEWHPLLLYDARAKTEAREC